MPSSSLIVPLIFVAGLVGGAVQAAPVPPPALAEAQLRAINHRFVDAHIVANIDFMATLTSADFRLTGGDGSWHDRADYLATMLQPAPLDGASYQDVRVRLFGPVAVVHGAFGAMPKEGKAAKVRYTDVYFWDGEAWRLVSAQNTPIQDGVAVQQHKGSAPAHAPWQGQDPTGDDLAILRTLNEHYVKAFREADVAWYDAHLAPDYVSVSSDGSFHDRAATLADFAEPSFAIYMKSFPVDKVTIRRFDDVALIHAENAYERKDGRKGVSRYTDIWFKQDGTWRCIAAHITTHKAPA
ncbi:MAG: nuclear transport factor 2 family protein [Luteimonas sp.]|nr:nuclear transport factor 2 family protein [Luteimonas sp.]